MSKLEELYQSLDLFQENNWPIPSELLKGIEETESDITDEELVESLKDTLSPFVRKIKRPYKLVIGIDNDGKMQIDIKRGKELVINKPTKDGEKVKRSRKSAVGFGVQFTDGTYYHELKAVDTFIKSLKKIGLKTIAEDSQSPDHSGYRVVGTVKREDLDNCQKMVDGYYIYVKISNETKILDLQKLSSRYDLGLKITIGGAESELNTELT